MSAAIKVDVAVLGRLGWQLTESALRPVEGIVEALDRIALPSCVASSGSHEKMQFTLGLAGLYERFRRRIFSATDVACGKPAPDIFLYAAAKMGTAPSACVVVEDSAIGVATARSAGAAGSDRAISPLLMSPAVGKSATIRSSSAQTPEMENAAEAGGNVEAASEELSRRISVAPMMDWTDRPQCRF